MFRKLFGAKRASFDEKNRLAAEYVMVPAGSFMMGAVEGDTYAYDIEQPAHRVELTTPFYMKATPVTEQEWAEVMGFLPWSFNFGLGDPHLELPDSRQMPIVNITWFEAIWFCNQLSKRASLPPAYQLEGVEGESGSGDFFIHEVIWHQNRPGFRLPTEAEWEYCCKAGGHKGHHYWFLRQAAWYQRNSGSRLHNVAEKKPNNWGFFDMLGLVYEWVFDDWRRIYENQPLVDPVYLLEEDEQEIMTKCTRGAPFNAFHAKEYCRETRRRSLSMAGRAENTGIRVCRSIGENLPKRTVTSKGWRW